MVGKNQLIVNQGQICQMLQKYFDDYTFSDMKPCVVAEVKKSNLKNNKSFIITLQGK